MRCLTQYTATLGEKNHRVADTNHRIADHYMHLENYSKAELVTLDAEVSSITDEAQKTHPRSIEYI